MSARAVNGKRCPHSGVGEDFLVRRPGLFLRKRPIFRNEKSKNQSEGVKSTVLPRAINGSLMKSGVLQQKTDFLAEKQIFGQKNIQLWLKTMF